MGRLEKRQAHWFNDLVMSPYTLREGIRVMLANWFPDNSISTKMDPCSHAIMFDESGASRLKVGLVGDIMDMRGFGLEWGEEISAFFTDCDAVIGNFEAVMAPRRTHLLQQRHTAVIMRELKKVAPSEKWFLSVANNHAGDFGPAAFKESCRALSDEGFQVFGTRENPFVDLPGVRVTTGSMWTNMPCDRIADLDDLVTHVSRERLNLFYPHWGYELECQPRTEILALGKMLLEHADVVVGHHSHVPHAVQVQLAAEGRPKVLAPSLGNLCTGTLGAGYEHGLMMKLTLGGHPCGAIRLCKAEWRPLRIQRVEKIIRVSAPRSKPGIPPDNRPSAE